MLGEFINRILVLVLAFAFPAFECFKTLEQNRVDVDQLRFWCQYWIIVAVLSIIERFADMFISWVPLYGEMKLAFIIYLWYPRTRGTDYVYERFLRPFVTRHETDIDQNLQDLRYRIWDLAIYYYQNCTELGQGAFFNVLEYLLNQSSRLRGGGGRGGGGGSGRGNKPDHKKIDRDQPRPSGPPPQPVPPADFIPILSPLHNVDRDSRIPPPSPRRTDGAGAAQRRHAPPPPPSAPPMPTSFFRSLAPSTPKSKMFRQEPPKEAQTEYVHVDELFRGGEDFYGPNVGSPDNRGPAKSTDYLARSICRRK